MISPGFSFSCKTLGALWLTNLSASSRELNNFVKGLSLRDIVDDLNPRKQKNVDNTKSTIDKRWSLKS